MISSENSIATGSITYQNKELEESSFSMGIIDFGSDASIWSGDKTDNAPHPANTL